MADSHPYLTGFLPGGPETLPTGGTTPPTHVMRTPRVLGHTHRGLVRPKNEDAFFIAGKGHLPTWCALAAGVFDGVGGLSNGHEASTRAAEYTVEMLQHWPQGEKVWSHPEQAMEQLLLEIHRRLLQDQAENPALSPMATTGTIAVQNRERLDRIWIGHVGDSPALRIRQGDIQAVIAEDSLVGQWAAEGLISAAQARTHPQRHVITQALGKGRGLIPHVTVQEVKPEDLLILCTDGLTNLVSLPEILKLAQQPPNAGLSARLVKKANEMGGLDNITAVVIEF